MTSTAPSDRPVVDTPRRLITAGRRRFDALRALLRDLREVVPGSGQPPAVSLTITATVDAVEGRLGTLPGQLTSSGLPVPLSTATLQRMGCHSELNIVLLDALGRPVGAWEPTARRPRENDGHCGRRGDLPVRCAAAVTPSRCRTTAPRGG